MIEIGKTYEFKTMTFYYIGTVEQMYPTHVRIKNAVQVFDTGPNSEYYSGKIKSHEHIPDGSLVPLSGTMIIPWLHKIP